MEEEQSDDRTVDQAAALGCLLAFAAAGGAARAKAGGEDGGALVGGQGRELGRGGSAAADAPEPLKSVSGEQPDQHGRAGVAGRRA